MKSLRGFELIQLSSCQINVSDSDIVDTNAVNLVCNLVQNASNLTVDLVEAYLTTVNEVLTEVE